ncbi:MAG: HD domain-containing protein [Beijerinckiaceae bacterium]|nr:HD domain-containing protein [Beijerinckiaceae bacterium]
MARRKCLLFVSGAANRSAELHQILKRKYTCFQLSLEKFTQGSVVAVDGIVIDIDLSNSIAVERLKHGLALVDRRQTFVVCVVNEARPADVAGAQALQVDDVLPLHKERTADETGGEPKASSAFSEFTVASLLIVEGLLDRHEARDWEPAAITEAFEAGDSAMTAIFDLARAGKPPEMQHLRQSSRQISNALAEHGLSRWVEKVRLHHSATYQHCLIVTGVAAAFGRSLRLCEQDIERLTLGGMLHDIGKSMIPIDILEKPGPLSAEEWAIMRTHPTIGRTIVEQTGGFDSEMADVVAHHHEYLDGTGYPDGLKGSEISDIVRVMTISDIFGALIERRTYKPEMSCEQAYEIILSMKTKLDVALVRAFRETAFSLPLTEVLKVAV